MRDLPVISLEVRALGEVISSHFAAHAELVSKEVSAGVKRVVETLDFEAEVRRIAQPILAKALANAIESYFWGDGRKIIDEAVRSALAAMAQKP